MPACSPFGASCSSAGLAAERPPCVEGRKPCLVYLRLPRNEQQARPGGQTKLVRAKVNKLQLRRAAHIPAVAVPSSDS